MAENEWSVEDFRWYQRVGEYSLVHWWCQERDHAEMVSADTENALLARKARSGRMEFRTEAILWEVLRRHPDLRPLRERFHMLWSLLPSGVTRREFNVGVSKLLGAWHGRGFSLLDRLVRDGHRDWSSLDEPMRVQIEGAVREYAAEPENFPTGRRLRGYGSVNVASIQSLPGPFGEDPPPYILPQDRSVREYQKHAARRGKRLALLEFDSSSSTEKIVAGLRELLEHGTPLSPGDVSPRLESESSAQAKYLHLGDNTLSRIEKLDALAPGCRLREIKGFRTFFQDFRLR